MIEHVAEKIKDADLVLVGLGEELDAFAAFRDEPKYQSILKKLENSWMLPFIYNMKMEEIIKEQKELYKLLSSCLYKKNYFIVSVCMDGAIRETGLDEGRIVEPCGGYRKLQCSGKCNTELYEIPVELQQQINKFYENESCDDEPAEPVCPICGSSLVFNNVNALNYVEEGYLEQWSIYKKWLQGTVNKKICILEVGVGMKYPTVIRWPFEKITFYNNKAELFRVHSRLYQISEEIKGKGYGICKSPEEFIKELSNIF